MYKEFYNFSAEPFRVTPDPGFLYLTDQHKEALAAIIYGIAKRKGFVCITGEVGVGKTTILKSYLDSVDEPGLRFVYIYNPAVSFLALLKHIFKEIGLYHPGEEIAGMVDALRAWLIEAHKRRETLVLLIDEAQNMPMGTLESLRMLSNLETATEKLVQIVLVGQPELEAQLAERQLRQLESRIAVRTRLGPLSRADSVAYIRHRLKCVALDDRPAFTDGAIQLLARRAKGIPRRINVLCDNALMTGFGHKARPVTARIVREVLCDLRLRDGSRMPPWLADLSELAPGMSWRAVALGGAGVAVAGAALWAGVALVETGGGEADPAALVSELRRSANAIPDKPSPRLEAVIRPEKAVVKPEPEPKVKVELLPPLPSQPPAVEIEIAAPAHTPAGPPPEMSTLEARPAAASPATQGKRVLRIARQGDTLAGLTMEVYGRFDRVLLDQVKERNPDIVNVDRIQVGQVIEFPAMAGAAGD